MSVIKFHSKDGWKGKSNKIYFFYLGVECFAGGSSPLFPFKNNKSLLSQPIPTYHSVKGTHRLFISIPDRYL